MLTHAFYQQLATMIKSGPQAWGPLGIAIGQGNQSWDHNPPILRRETMALTSEVARKIVTAEDILYLGDSDEVSAQATSRLRLQTEFIAGEGSGTLRECGVFVGAGNNAVLIAYFNHPRVEKQQAASLQRSIILDLAPARILSQEIPTRYLGNAKTTELHDVENETGGCQLDEIRLDRRHFFASTEEAVGFGYDYCAFCFGKELSER